MHTQAHIDETTGEQLASVHRDPTSDERRVRLSPAVLELLRACAFNDGIPPRRQPSRRPRARRNSSSTSSRSPPTPARPSGAVGETPLIEAFPPPLEPGSRHAPMERSRGDREGWPDRKRPIAGNALHSNQRWASARVHRRHCRGTRAGPRPRPARAAPRNLDRTRRRQASCALPDIARRANHHGPRPVHPQGEHHEEDPSQPKHSTRRHRYVYHDYRLYPAHRGRIGRFSRTSRDAHVHLRRGGPDLRWDRRPRPHLKERPFFQYSLQP